MHRMASGKTVCLLDLDLTTMSAQECQERAELGTLSGWTWAEINWTISLQCECGLLLEAFLLEASFHICSEEMHLPLT